MNDLSPVQANSLPALIDHAARALAGARDSAEVLEARDMARVAYDAAKSAGRIAKAKAAHDEVIGAVYRAQADALLIEARAKARLADEYDAAQERGEIRKRGNPILTNGEELPGPEVVGGDKELHEARQIRDAERADPGMSERALAAMVDRHEEPTKAALRRSVLAAVEDAKLRPSRKNPNRKKCAETDRVSKFTGLCRSLAEFSDDVEAIAHWDRIPSMSERLPGHVRVALGVLNRFMEAKDA